MCGFSTHNKAKYVVIIKKKTVEMLQIGCCFYCINASVK